MRVFGKVLKNARFARSFKSARSARNATFLRKFAREFFVSFAMFLNFKIFSKSAGFWDFERVFSVLFVRFLSVFEVLKNVKNVFKFREVFEKIFRIFVKNVFKFFDSFKFLVFRVFAGESGYG